MNTALKLSVGTVVVLLAMTLLLFWSLSAVDPVRTGAGFSHLQLEADRVMTQRMATEVQMPMDSAGMLTRSSNPAYVRALELHAAEIDRMLGRAPSAP